MSKYYLQDFPEKVEVNSKSISIIQDGSIPIIAASGLKYYIHKSDLGVIREVISDDDDTTIVLNGRRAYEA